MALKAEAGYKINCLNTPSDEILKDTGIFPLQFRFVWVQKGWPDGSRTPQAATDAPKRLIDTYNLSKQLQRFCTNVLHFWSENVHVHESKCDVIELGSIQHQPLHFYSVCMYICVCVCVGLNQKLIGNSNCNYSTMPFPNFQ